MLHLLTKRYRLSPVINKHLGPFRQALLLVPPKMQPDHGTSYPWNSFSQNWFRSPMASTSSFYAVPEFHSDTSRAMSLTEQIHNHSAGDKRTTRMPMQLNACGIPSLQSSPSNYPLQAVDGCYSPQSSEREDVAVSKQYPYRGVNHGMVGSSELEQDYMQKLLEKSKPATGTIDPSPSRNAQSSGFSYIDEKMMLRPQRGRTVFSAKQLQELENIFVIDQYISGQQRRRLSSRLGLTETQVRVWFQNRRIKWRKQKLERKIKA